MTETTGSTPNGTGLLWVVAIAVIFALLMMRGLDVKQEEVRESCMNGVVAPKASDPEYDDKMLEFTSDVRACLRG